VIVRGQRFLCDLNLFVCVMDFTCLDGGGKKVGHEFLANEF
jgi:hypothetical protein